MYPYNNDTQTERNPKDCYERILEIQFIQYRQMFSQSDRHYHVRSDDRVRHHAERDVSVGRFAVLDRLLSVFDLLYVLGDRRQGPHR